MFPKMHERTAVIVDGYSSGAGFARELRKFGFRCAHVQSDYEVPRVYRYTYNPDDYAITICFPKYVKKNIEVIRAFNPEFIIPGAESGVELADFLSNELKLKTANPLFLSPARRNKFLMQEELKKNGLPHISQFCANNVQDVVAWSEKRNKWPVVVKPLNSAGGEGINYCYSSDDVKRAAEHILMRPYNMLGFENKSILVQELLEGEELVVNTVSIDGKPYLCELWRYEKYSPDPNHSTYSTMQTICYKPHQHAKIVDYAFQVITALGIKNGPAHCEIMLTVRGPILIECAARVMGANLPFNMLSSCIRHPQAIMNVLSYVNPKHFDELWCTRKPVSKHFIVVFLISKQKGVIRSIQRGLDEIKQLPAFHSMKLALQVGDNIYPTIDYETCPGLVYLCHENKDVLDHSFSCLRIIESKRLFMVKSEGIKV